MIRLHDYWRSGAGYRVRMVLALKGLPYHRVSYNLRLGEQSDEGYRQLAPLGLVPALEADGAVLTQSMAIMEWLEEQFPSPSLLPANFGDKAIVRSICQTICCDIHPLNNLRVLSCLRSSFDASEEAISDWIEKWIVAGFEAIEPLIARHGRGFAFGEEPSLADCCLVPQVYSANRFGINLTDYPNIVNATRQTLDIESVAQALPERQDDAA